MEVPVCSEKIVQFPHLKKKKTVSFVGDAQLEVERPPKFQGSEHKQKAIFWVEYLGMESPSKHSMKFQLKAIYMLRSDST